jgi:hypothetical protein
MHIGNWDFAASTVSTSGKLSPAIKWFDPNGKLLATSAELQSDPLPADGTYVIIVSDVDGTQTGDYAVNLQKVY